MSDDSKNGEIIAGILRAESYNDRRNWRAEPKPPLGTIRRLDDELPPGVERDGYALLRRWPDGRVERIVMCVELARDGEPWIAFPLPYGGELSPYFMLMRVFADSWQYRSTAYLLPNAL